VARIGRMAAGKQDRRLDLGYRAHDTGCWLGWIGMQKIEIARVMKQEALRRFRPKSLTEKAVSDFSRL
jgi:hypothetical protein